MARLWRPHLSTCDRNRTQPSPAIAEALARGEIIKPIKLLRAQNGMGLGSAQEQVDAWL